MEVVLRCKNDVCVGAALVNFTTLLIFYVVCLAFHRWGHAVVIIISRFTVGYKFINNLNYHANDSTVN